MVKYFQYKIMNIIWYKIKQTNIISLIFMINSIEEQILQFHMNDILYFNYQIVEVNYYFDYYFVENIKDDNNLDQYTGLWVYDNLYFQIPVQLYFHRNFYHYA